MRGTIGDPPLKYVIFSRHSLNNSYHESASIPEIPAVETFRFLLGVRKNASLTSCVVQYQALTLPVLIPLGPSYLYRAFPRHGHKNYLFETSSSSCRLLQYKEQR